MSCRVRRTGSCLVFPILPLTAANMTDQGGSERPTLIRPPPNDPDKAPIENALDVLELGVLGPVSPFLSHTQYIFLYSFHILT